MDVKYDKSVDICKVAIRMSISSREEEKKLMKEYAK